MSSLNDNNKARQDKGTPMADETTNDNTHIGVKRETQRKVAILAKVLGPNTHMYDLVELWANREWEIARQGGLVTDAMLKPFQAHVVGKENVVEFDINDGKKLLKAIKLQPVKKNKQAVKA